MEIIAQFSQIILHLDDYLAVVVQNYGFLTYAILFFIIFMETGFVVTPFLPGDSLLFASGALASVGVLNFPLTLLLFCLAAILGDNINYWLGKFIGPKVFSKKAGFLLNQKHLAEAHSFYEKHGGKTIILARFIPIIRTFAPFVAGIGKMEYAHFFSYNVIGGMAWVTLFTTSGLFFGNLPLVKENFSFIILGIITISLIPLIIDIVKGNR